MPLVKILFYKLYIVFLTFTALKLYSLFIFVYFYIMWLQKGQASGVTLFNLL